MSGYIEQLIQCLMARELTMLEILRLAHTMMELGTKPALAQQYGIVPNLRGDKG